ncbi:alpha/beta hydrolase [Nesterenkonia xinjiangensis]|uniref:Acetyl esterase/lipase n=1 Tax=Nesterenkonia xinjiangensis TaxID=225327 RepID=A0A7Z0GKW3_9MICC|nr:alpha/beta hydrolase [Nesterenkonia xinjiangensis]NYJ77815.1 acetyl esterase/lipase [Nesterenkonia xinjiangensis]
MHRTVVAELDAVGTQDHVLDGPHGPLPVRLYRGQDAAPARPGPALVWAHGGGFAYGDVEMAEADWVARSLAARGIPVVSVGYRLAPALHELDAGDLAQAGPEAGVHYPVPGEELAAAFDWTRTRAADLGAAPDQVSLGGASAGGNLAAGVALTRLRRSGHDGGGNEAGHQPAQLILAYPTLHAVQPPTPAELRALLDADPEADRFGAEPVRRMYENYLGGTVDDAPVGAVPGTATVAELTGHPPTTIVTGEVDELRVSAEAYAAALREAGVDVEIHMAQGVRHGHLNRPDEGPAAEQTIDWFAARMLRTV